MDRRLQQMKLLPQRALAGIRLEQLRQFQPRVARALQQRGVTEHVEHGGGAETQGFAAGLAVGVDMGVDEACGDEL